MHDCSTYLAHMNEQEAEDMVERGEFEDLSSNVQRLNESIERINNFMSNKVKRSPESAANKKTGMKYE